MADIRRVLCVCALLASALEAGASSQVPSSIARLRPLGDRAALMLTRGVERSMTFGSIVDRLEQSDVVVYIEIIPRQAGRPAGQMHWVTSSPYLRFLRVSLRQDLACNALLALLAHELQHALEVAEAPEIRDGDSFRRHYEQFGLHVRAQHRFDSEAALQVGRRVREELAATIAERGEGDEHGVRL